MDRNMKIVVRKHLTLNVCNTSILSPLMKRQATALNVAGNFTKSFLLTSLSYQYISFFIITKLVCCALYSQKNINKIFFTHWVTHFNHEKPFLIFAIVSIKGWVVGDFWFYLPCKFLDSFESPTPPEAALMI